MTAPILSPNLRANDHRLLWWMLAHQQRSRGVGTGTLRGDWRRRAMNDLHLSKKALFLAQERLKVAGIITCQRFQRNARVNGEAFLL